MVLSIGPATKLLFIGDSITDAGRASDPEGLGFGYVRIVRDVLLARDPANAPVVINRGVNGQMITDLQARWQADVLDASPDVISIYVGINDVVNELLMGGSNLHRYGEVYQAILAGTRQALPQAAIVLCEPSVLWLPGYPDGNARLAPYVEVVHVMAEAYDAIGVVKLHDTFGRAREARADVAWLIDGVHPTSTGHMLIAQRWLAATGPFAVS